MQSRQKNLLIFSAILGLAATAWLFFSPFGWLKLRRARQAKEQLEKKIELIETANKKMARKADCLGAKSDCFEKTARKKYGLIGRDEILVILPKRDKKK